MAMPRRVPRGRYTDLIGGDMLSAVVAQGIAEFQDVTVEQGYFTPDQGLQLMRRSHELGLARTRARRRMGFVARLAYGSRRRRRIGRTPHVHAGPTRSATLAEPTRSLCILPMAELVYMTDRRAERPAVHRDRVPVAIATDFCSSIRATSLLNTLAIAAPWFRMTPGEVIVGCHAQRRLQPRQTVVVRLTRCRQTRRSDHPRLLASRRGVSCRRCARCSTQVVIGWPVVVGR